MTSTKSKANNNSNKNMNINKSNLHYMCSQSSSYFNDIKYVQQCQIDVYTHSCCCFHTQHVKVQVGLYKCTYPSIFRMFLGWISMSGLVFC